MKFIHRLAYYLGGVTLGVIILLFFLNKKEASCAYGPNARTVKNISSKPLYFSDEALQTMQQQQIDSITVVNLIKYGDVDFSQSNQPQDSCKIYVIENSYKKQPYALRVLNCDNLARVLMID